MAHLPTLRIWFIVAGVVCALLLAAFALAPVRGAVTALFRLPSSSYDWVSRTMSDCEQDAATQPQSLNVLVIPLEATRRFGADLRAKALSDAGGTVLLGSQDALQALRDGAVRISSMPYVLHLRDTVNNMTHRWASASGVTRLTSSDIPSDGPFELRFQVTPEDRRPEWSTITAEGRGTCHWAFAVMPR